MKTLIIMLIFSLAFIGFHINGDITSLIKKPETRENREDETVNVNVNVNANANENENGNGNGNDNEKIFNEMGDLLNPPREKFENIRVIDMTTFKGEGMASAKPQMNPSSRLTDDNGLTINFGSYKDNFPYESSYIKKINSKNVVEASKNVPINKYKNQSKVSNVILPDGIKEYVEDFDYFKKSVSIVKGAIGESNKILLVPHERIINKADKISNYLPDEIVFKTRPEMEEFIKQRNYLLATTVNKNEMFYETAKNIKESKMLFNLN